jgi:hypothetical protein
MLRPGELLIHDGNTHLVIDPHVGGERKSRGLIPRDYGANPVGYLGKLCPPLHAIDFPLIPEGEWSARCKDKAAQKSQLSDIRLGGNNGQPIPSLDQGQVGYCWGHSSTHANMLVRAVMNEPYVPLSAYAVCATIKHGADEGGWGALSLDFITSRGEPSQQLWPQGDRDYRKYDKPEVWANAALHKVTEGWVDLQAAQYDRNLSRAQTATLLLCNIPVVTDYNFWGHSVCGMDLVDGATTRDELRADSGKLMSLAEFDRVWLMNDEAGGFGVRLWNSWGDKWSDRGMGTLGPSKAWPDGAVAPRVTTPSVA